ncbi:cupin domain-containing protein [Agrobacterium rhizogenes]|uniref:cupin domain-containing protein n=1 Tax=Rhizobium rhizogenes TaxID=359 RepID=UPI00157363A5|nr:cupin domain-containing protein [Rhizobium rhizogenes]NTI17606.1 cupin domain-containing protein [Rhizobium rhizogenes]
MGGHSQAVITTAEERPLEEWNDPSRGRISWHTLFSSDRTPTDSMTAGVAEIAPGSGALQPHRHEQPEIYFILEGTGILTVDGRETAVTAGTAVFIPGNAEHGIRNDSNVNVKLFYVFPTGSFEDVVYRFGAD